MSAAESARILVVEDEDLARWSIKEHLVKSGHDVEAVATGEDAVDHVVRNEVDLLLLDVRLPGIDGIAVLREAMRRRPDVVGVMMSSHGTIHTAIDAMKLGALDFLVKPFSLQELDTALLRALTLRRSRDQVASLAAEPDRSKGIESIIGKSAAIEEVRYLVTRVASNDSASVLIKGESGAGKDVVARAIHASGARAERMFCQVNCGALTELALESELFGHERGAFEGAHSRKLGLFEAAVGGTLLLDELGEMPKSCQVKLLMLLETGSFRRIGGTVDVPADVRVMVSAREDLEASVRRGDLRDDLYFRLNVFSMEVPPLREHREDVEMLSAHFITRFNRRTGASVRGVSVDALAALSRYDWPGNVRELRNVVTRALIMDPRAEELRVDHLPPRLHTCAASMSSRLDQFDDITLATAEQRLIELALERSNGNKTRAARELGISRDALRYRMRKHEMLQDGEDGEDGEDGGSGEPAMS